MKLQTEHLKLYAVTDRSWLGERTLARQVEESLAGGATMVQLREKGMDRETLRREALEIRAVCRRYGVPFLINDAAELAAEVGADGVHVGQQDMSPAGQGHFGSGRDRWSFCPYGGGGESGPSRRRGLSGSGGGLCHRDQGEYHAGGL